MRFFKAAIFGLALAVAALGTKETLAQTLHVERYGAWEFSLNRSPQGRAICTLSIFGTRGDTRSLHIKYIIGENRFTVHAFKNSWAIRQDAYVPIRMRIDGHSGWEANARGNGNFLEWYIGADKMVEFFRLFRAGLIMYLDFPMARDESTWVVSLRGSSNATISFLGCVRGLLDAGSGQRNPPIASEPAPRSVPQTRPDARNWRT